MPFIIWREAYQTGFKDIDTQHKKLVDLINILFEALSQKEDRTILNNAFTDLINYCIYHFSLEEELMIKFGYSEYTNHRKEHMIFTTRLNLYLNDFKTGDKKALVSIINFLKDWLIQHIMGTDRKYISTFQANNHK